MNLQQLKIVRETVRQDFNLTAVAEALYAVLYQGKEVETQNAMSKVHMTGEEWRRSWPAWLRATLAAVSRKWRVAGESPIRRGVWACAAAPWNEAGSCTWPEERLRRWPARLAAAAW